jgi:hypothetical protein
LDLTFSFYSEEDAKMKKRPQDTDFEKQELEEIGHKKS